MTTELRIKNKKNKCESFTDDGTVASMGNGQWAEMSVVSVQSVSPNHYTPLYCTPYPYSMFKMMILPKSKELPGIYLFSLQK
jgi:hypothetical protein